MSDEPTPTEPHEPRRVKVQSSAERERRRHMRAKQSKADALPLAPDESTGDGREGEVQATKSAAERPGTATAPAKQPKRKKSRGHVCHKCGKYFDVTARKPGETFDCYCGETLEVPKVAQRDGPAFNPRNHELQKKIRYTVLGTASAAVLGTLLIFWGVLRIYEVGVRVPNVLTLLFGLGFLAAAFMINGEGKRAKEELAEASE
ncbi:MAG: hypothetical protein AAGK78_00575 [Planctomycetota bacterium]